jgi:hypothetical protein
MSMCRTVQLAGARLGSCHGDLWGWLFAFLVKGKGYPITHHN